MQYVKNMLRSSDFMLAEAKFRGYEQYRNLRQHCSMLHSLLECTGKESELSGQKQNPSAEVVEFSACFVLTRAKVIIPAARSGVAGNVKPTKVLSSSVRTDGAREEAISHYFSPSHYFSQCGVKMITDSGYQTEQLLM